MIQVLVVLQMLQSTVFVEHEVSLVYIVFFSFSWQLFVLNFYTDPFLVLAQRRVVEISNLKL